MTMSLSVSKWVEQLQSQGRYVFTRQEAEVGTGCTEAATMIALRRMRQREQLTSPRRGFFVIVPPEYRVTGSPPANWFIDDLMRYMGQPYYVGLLTAAAIHGAAHQQPMVFQVMTDRPTREVRAGKVFIRFSISSRLDRMPVTVVQTETGTMRVATPETTAFDLVRYPSAVGHLSNATTVLAELSEGLDARTLVATADLMRLPDVQRLGYLLEEVGSMDLAELLHGWLRTKRPRAVPLQPGVPVDVEIDKRWHIQPNVELEVDL